MCLGLRMPEHSSFIRSIRIRYLSGLLIFALASAAVVVAFSQGNAYRRSVDAIASDLLSFTRDLRNATNFAETTTTAWRPDTREALALAARNHAARLETGIEQLTAAIDAIHPQLSAKSQRRDRQRLYQWRPVLVGARHGAQPRRAGDGAKPRRMELSRDPQPERPVRPADAGARPRRDGRRTPARRSTQRQTAC